MRLLGAALAASTILASPVAAQVLTTDLDTWKFVTGDYSRDTSYGDNFSDLSTLTLDNGPTLSFGTPVSVATIGNGWATWSGGYTGQVLVTSGSSITVNLNPSVTDFGFFAEPNSFSPYLIQLSLAGGGSVQQLVNGSAGAKFFGWNGGGVSSFTVSTNDSLFAFGDFYYSSAVPEPATWALMILGFGAVGGAMRRRQSVAAKVRFA
jgi:hypothetical protein